MLDTYQNTHDGAVRYAVFRRDEVQALLNALPSHIFDLKVTLAVNGGNDVDMVIAGDTSASGMIWADISGNGVADEGIISARPCPPYCHQIG